MGKKNPYVTTIGFNKDDPEHVRTAEILNNMGRGKASYITKAILTYETMIENGEIVQQGFASGMDYESLRGFVLKIIAEHEGKPLVQMDKTEITEITIVESEQKYEKKLAEQIGFDEKAIQDIMMSVEAFRG